MERLTNNLSAIIKYLLKYNLNYLVKKRVDKTCSWIKIYSL